MRIVPALLAAIAVALSSAACGVREEDSPPATVSGQRVEDGQIRDPLAKRQWALDAIHGRNPLEQFRRTPVPVTIAILDTGVALRHPDLRSRLWRNPEEVPGPIPMGDPRHPPQGPVRKGTHGWDTLGTDRPPSVAPDDSPEDRSGHGTPVASIAAAATGNGIGMTGVAPNGVLLPVRTCWIAGYQCFDDLTGASMSWAAERGARVLNLSLVSRGHEQIEAAIVAHPEALFVAAAANDERDLDVPGRDIFPCEIPAPNVICVAGSGRDGALTSCSNFGANAVDVAAPGDGVTMVAVYGYTKASTCGTSVATPHVSGLAALLFGAVPEADAEEVRQAILDGVTPSAALAGKVATGGVIDVRRSLDLLQDRFDISRP